MLLAAQEMPDVARRCVSLQHGRLISSLRQANAAQVGGLFEVIETAAGMYTICSIASIVLGDVGSGYGIFPNCERTRDWTFDLPSRLDSG